MTDDERYETIDEYTAARARASDPVETRQTIPTEEMPAGRELDAAVAEALGHEIAWAGEAGRRNPRFWKRGVSHHSGQVKVRRLTPVSGYSTDIAAAWELWERSQRDSSAWEEFCSYLEEMYQIQKYFRAGVITAYHSLLASISPLTICRAFLLANGVTEVRAIEDLSNSPFTKP